MKLLKINDLIGILKGRTSSKELMKEARKNISKYE